MATITLEIPDELAARWSTDEARRHLEMILKHYALTTPSPAGTTDSVTDFAGVAPSEAAWETLWEHFAHAIPADRPALPADALRRESFYDNAVKVHRVP